MDYIVLGIALSSCLTGACIGYLWQSVADRADASEWAKVSRADQLGNMFNEEY
jgi:hypothetical protein